MNARRRHDWMQTAALLAMIWNRTIWGKGKTKSPSDFYNPDGKKSGTPLRSDNVVELLDKWG